MDCTAFDKRFLSIISTSSNLSADLPDEAQTIIYHSHSLTNNAYLEALSRLAIHPTFSSVILVCYEQLYPELIARWSMFASPIQLCIGLGRILPVVPHLVELAEYLLLSNLGASPFLPGALGLHVKFTPEEVCSLNADQALEILLSLHRLLSTKHETFLALLDSATLCHLRYHPHRAVRYMAVRLLCRCLKATESAREDMLQNYGVGKHSEKILGVWEGREVDYGFLTLLEGERFKELANELEKPRIDSPLTSNTTISRKIESGELSHLSVSLCDVLIPHLRGGPKNPIDIVYTPTTRANIYSLALALRTCQPILVTGYAGSGKTFLIHQIAKSLGALDSLVSIHLGDQTDAKLLIGTYTTAETPGSFEWSPGVLATAVKEGRWVLVEDIDKAPTEVLSVLLPLIECGELDLPSRGEKIKAARGFRLITTAQTSLSTNQDASRVNLLGNRLWIRVNVQSPTQPELETIVNSKYPLLRAISSSIMSTYDRTQRLYQEPSFLAISRTSLGRQISPRDLFKWCRRMHALFVSAGVQSGYKTLPEGLFDVIFSEAVDCFAGSLHTFESRALVVNHIAQELHIPLQRVDLFLNGRNPSLKDSERVVSIGRVILKKRKDPTTLKRRKKTLGSRERPFATTSHALRLLEQVGAAVRLSEPVLLVGETGTGKTTVIQRLADILGFTLTAINLSQQTESGDLLGGYKPVDVRSLAVPLKERFGELFEKTFSLKKNKHFLDTLEKCWNRQQWKRVIVLWVEAVKMAEGVFAHAEDNSEGQLPLGKQQKKRNLNGVDKPALQALWIQFSHDLSILDRQSSQLSKSFAFSFVEGSLVKAARNGGWVLLDEINLAAADTLESIADLLKDGGGGSISLSEKGDAERIQAHPDFRIFACMNPATDVGKRDLPPGLRSRFTELYVASPDTDFGNLLAIVNEYIGHLAIGDERVCANVAELYMEAKKLSEGHRLVDGANQKAHFSIRTLSRTLSYAVEISGIYGLRRSLYEGFCMSFLTFLDQTSEMLLLPIIDKHILNPHRNVRSLINQIPKNPRDGYEYVQFKHYWMRRGSAEPEEQLYYIITPFVERNMLNLVRATATRKFPVLVQGPTSSGKTSMIEFLAKKTGHKFVRINNHEHTDLQEYLGTYVSDTDGKLHFREGILVDALRKGHWIVLDELNLAPTDVLEALNRLLDDNRELLIPETQKVVRPHRDFMLFATQNPPGLYGGRKHLSRAFRSRFLELHFDDIPEAELGTILKERCQIAPSYGDKIVKVYKELSLLRQSTRLFEQKNSFATLRDLFRWANREAVGYQQLAENGYILLAERVRKDEEKLTVKQVLEKEMRVKINVNSLYTAERTSEYSLYTDTIKNGNIVWTKAMRRLFSLVAHALRNNEPVLLVGETGCGKTTVCQILADTFGKQLIVVNAHQNTETGDIIGAQRPIRNRSTFQAQLAEDISTILSLQGSLSGPETPRNIDLSHLLEQYLSLPPETKNLIPSDVKERIETNRIRNKGLFEWTEGPLVQAMKGGQFFLLDEISLADDSVLERLNSVLEPARGILLAEKGPEEGQITAINGFQFLSTMNPGGDYGKKELSPALRNRFTEIWVPSMTDSEDVLQIVRSKLKPEAANYDRAIVEFAQWFAQTYNFSSSAAISIRDVLAWIQFVNLQVGKELGFGLLHGAALVFFDGLGANPSTLLTMDAENLVEEKKKCIQKLSDLVGMDMLSFYPESVSVVADESTLRIGPFSLARKEGAMANVSFSLEAPTTAMNAMRVIRAMYLRKPILLEGSPGVGKTSLVTALAGASGHQLTRINLSEQTDLMDLFGSDVPVERGQGGEFSWRDAPFLRAMQKGHWVLLDEMNLASQSVLEGLNACLDHRGEVYISELDRTFGCHPEFVVFAAQNPHHQGGGRKGLPASFVNRFTVVYVDLLSFHDLQLIARKLFPTIQRAMVDKLISFVVRVSQEVGKRGFGVLGGPWEFNLRDTLRWLELLASEDGLLAFRAPEEFVDLTIKQRFRAVADRKRVDQIFVEIFGYAPPTNSYYYHLSENTFQVGHAFLERRQFVQPCSFDGLTILKWQLPILQTIMTCIRKNAPCILVGSSGTGKSSMIKLLAGIAGAELEQLALNADVDTTDIMGGFEQVDISRKISALFGCVQRHLREAIIDSVKRVDAPDDPVILLMDFLNSPKSTPSFENLNRLIEILSTSSTSSDAFEGFVRQAEALAAEAHKSTITRFEWVDSTLIQAVEEGKWLVLDNANLCSPSVLDRLNSLLERDGVLVVNEHSMANGDPKVVKPHPEFRLFITMDPKHGELSRAMRNRCVEVFIDISKSVLDTTASIDDNEREKYARFAASSGIEADFLAIQHLNKFIKTAAKRNIDLSAGLVKNALEHVPMNHIPAFLNRWKEYFNCSQNQPQIDVDVAVGSLIRFITHPTVNAVASGFVLSIDARIRIGQAFCNVQPVVPLRNTSTLSYKNASILWDFFDVACNILETQTTEGAIVQKSTTVKMTEMTFLERSASKRGKSPGFGGNVGVELFNFLSKVRKVFECWLGADSACRLEQEGLVCIREILHLWCDMVQLGSTTNLNESVFHVYLTLFEEWLSSATRSLDKAIVAATDNALEIFRAPLKLVTGLSMSVIWLAMKPSVPQTLIAWEQYFTLQAIMTRIDSIGVDGDIDTALRLKKSLVETATAALTENVDLFELTQELKSSISALEKTSKMELTSIPPKPRTTFSALFDILLKFKMLHRPDGGKLLGGDIVRMAHFANRSTESLVQYGVGGVFVNTAYEQVIADLWVYPLDNSAANGPSSVLSGKFVADMLRTSDSVKNTMIFKLEQLVDEVGELSRQFIFHIPEITSNRIEQLNDLLLMKIKQLFVIHKDYYDEAVFLSTIPLIDNLKSTRVSQNTNAIKSAFLSTQVEYLLGINSEHLAPAIDALVESGTLPMIQSISITGKAWVHFAIACIKLYVPNIAFDPAMKPMVERDRYLARKTEIKNKIEAEKLFELWFTGQDSNFSVQMLEKSLQELGDEPPHSLIARPQKSEMSSLQGDFSCLLQAVVDSKPHEKLLNAVLRKEEGFFSQETLFQTNLSRLIEKLQKGYPIYKDIVNPVVGFIYYLKLGLSLAVMGPEDSSPPDPKSFLWPYESPSDRSHLSVVANNDVQLLLLRQYAARSNTEGYEKLEKPARDNIHVIFQKLFRKWKQDVTQEKANAAADSSLYHYRGEAPDFDQQDFKSMFPDYEDDDEGKDPAVVKEQSSKKSDHRGAAIKISQIHDVLFSSVRNEKLTTLVRDGASVFMKVLGGSQAIFSPKTIEGLLPAVLLSLKDTTEWVKGHKKTSKTYDFYTHENMEQAHKLVAIVKQIHKRMVYILEIWPENSTLQDAVEICQQLFEFPSETPVAKFITKVEKLHGILNEWQSVASSEFSVAEHINAVTQLIISWRRLELTTWPKLFDLEDEKARLNANSWWFFLYESIIANPLELLTEDLKNHVRQLISNLMSFMTTSSLGEFSHRLRLVRVFAEHLKRILIDYPDVDSLYGAVRNFVVYYSQYEAAVHETLGKQRKLMEKEVTNVVLLASWKDTNIVALHDSAKRSHHKLYKVVRKYRQALENSVASLLQAGMTTVDFKEKSLGLFSTEGHALKFDFENVKTVYETLVTTWDSRPPRFRDLEEGVKMMQRVTKLPKDRLDISACFERFYTSVVSTTKELQSETPSTMSEDVKGLVKHLKTRKRKAFTDALKELRKMGLKSNLSSALLRKQANLEGILAATAPLEERWRDVVDVSGMQYYFVRISETVLKIRDVKEPAPDLNAQEVARICGFMEHLLAITLEQRTSLFTSLLGFEILRADMARYKELADLGDGISTVLHGRKELAPGRFSDLERGFQRLPKILGFTLDLLAIHSEFSGESIQEVEVIVQEWKKRAIELNELFSAESRKIIHENIWQASTKALVDASEEVLAEIMVQAEVIVLRRPELQYAIQPSIQCTLTTAVMHTDDMTDAGHVSTSIKELNASLQDLADSIFVALQMLNETQRGYPTEADEVGWLLKYQSISTASIKALHMKAVSQKIKKVIVKASNLQPFDVQSSLAVRAAFAAYYPIVHEYGSICRRFIQTLALDHKSVCKTTYTLAMTASTLLTKGFCMPAEQSDEGGDGSGKLEAGTGLGDGDGAQDISKDIQADEDLSELAQEKNSEDSKEEIEDEEDAVDMGQDEMEGEMGGMEKKDDVDDEGEGDKEDREDEMDEETGDVDGLDPAAVDEKMWDEKGDDDDKEKEGENSDGKQSKGYDLDAKKDNKKQNDIGEQGEAERDGERSDDEGPAEKDDSVRQHDEAGGIDQHVPEVDTLDLPDDMELDGDEGSDEDLDENGDMNMDDLSDVVSENDGAIKDDGKGEDQEDKFPESDVPSVEPEAVDADENDEEMGVELGDGLPDQEPQELEKPDDSLLAQQPEDRAKEAEETAPSEVQGVQGGVDNQDTNDQAQSAQQETGEEVKADDAQQGQGTDQDQSLQQDQQVGQASAKDNDPSQEKNREEKPSEQESTFRKVGDILEKWHRQRKEILNANEEDPDRPQVDNMEIDGPEFEHLPNEDTAADTQALGAATEEQVHGLDDSTAIDSVVNEQREAFQDDDPEKDEVGKEATPIEHDKDDHPDAEDSHAGVVIGDPKSSFLHEMVYNEDDEMDVDEKNVSEDMENGKEVPNENPNLMSFTSLRPREEARELWQHYESATKTLSAGLCEQLRLILEPTQATKMRGDFRTGKRLNMRRIIPYIASSYKKDKIWMRRAKPSKRQYQVILAVDDSKSMAEGSSSDLALETVALVARALSSLEVGQIAVLSFGADTALVHPFDKLFTSDSGVDVFSRFTFAQQKTDVRKLIETSLSLFSIARQQQSGQTSNGELWQLEIVISDGVCEDHDTLRRLVRRAHEQHVMVVFVVVDSVRENSILQLDRVLFEDGQIRTERYLDSFPFAYYLVVADVRELPGVLAGALRQWFSESVDCGM